MRPWRELQTENRTLGLEATWAETEVKTVQIAGNAINFPTAMTFALKPNYSFIANSTLQAD